MQRQTPQQQAKDSASAGFLTKVNGKWVYESGNGHEVSSADDLKEFPTTHIIQRKE